MRAQPDGGRLAGASAGLPLLAAKHGAAEKCPRAQDHRPSRQSRAISEEDAARPLTIENDRRRLARDLHKIVLPRQAVLDRPAEQLPVGLDARPPHRAAFGAIQHPIMDRGGVGRAADQPVEGIDLADEMPLAQPADGRIAAHRPDGGEIEGHQRSARAHSRGHRRRFASGMTAADHHDIKATHGAHLGA